MTIEVDYRLEDLEELFVPEAYAADSSKYRRKIRSGVLGWIVSIGIAVGSYFFIGYAQSIGNIRTPPEARRNFLVDIITLVLPGALAGVITVLVVFVTWRGARWRPRVKSTSSKSDKWKTRLVGYSLLAVFMAVVWVTLSSDWGQEWRPSRGRVVLMCWGPWLGVLIAVIACGPFFIIWQARRSWLTNPGFARHTTFELDEWGLKASDPLTRVEKHWSTFLRARETANLLVLVYENKTNYMIPKRAFASEADLEAARALLQNKLEQTSFLAKPLGFPMTPKPVEPLPAEP